MKVKQKHHQHHKKKIRKSINRSKGSLKRIKGKILDNLKIIELDDSLNTFYKVGSPKSPEPVKPMKSLALKVPHTAQRVFNKEQLEKYIKLNTGYSKPQRNHEEKVADIDKLITDANHRKNINTVCMSDNILIAAAKLKYKT